jgi:hypothetical protein
MFLLFRATLRPRVSRLCPLIGPKFSSSSNAFSSGHLPMRCPSCSKPLPTPLPACPNCSYISSLPSNTTYHEMFDLPCGQNPFVLSTSELKSRFRTAQAVCHPDAWTSKGKVIPQLRRDCINSTDASRQGKIFVGRNTLLTD